MAKKKTNKKKQHTHTHTQKQNKNKKILFIFSSYFFVLFQGNLSPVEYWTRNFQNIENIQIFVYVHCKSLKSLNLDLKQCLWYICYLKCLVKHMSSSIIEYIPFSFYLMINTFYSPLYQQIPCSWATKAKYL